MNQALKLIKCLPALGFFIHAILTVILPSSCVYMKKRIILRKNAFQEFQKRVDSFIPVIVKCIVINLSHMYIHNKDSSFWFVIYAKVTLTFRVYIFH